MNNNCNQKIIEDKNNFIEIGIDVGWSEKRKSSCIAFISKENPFDPSLNQFIANNFKRYNTNNAHLFIYIGLFKKTPFNDFLNTLGTYFRNSKMKAILVIDGPLGRHQRPINNRNIDSFFRRNEFYNRMQPNDVTGANGQLYVNVTYEYLSSLTGNNNPLPNWVEFLDEQRCFYIDETNPTVGLGLMLPPQDINNLPSRNNRRLVRGRLISAKSDFYWVEGANDIVAKLLDTPDINHFNEVNHEIVATLYCLCSARAIKLSRHISIGNDNGIYNFPCQIDADWSAIIANRINADNNIDIVSGQFCNNSEEENFSVNGDDVDLILNDNGAIWEKHNTWLLTCDNEVEVETLNFNIPIIRFIKSDNNNYLWTCDPTPLALARQFQPDLNHLSNKNFITIRCRLR